MTSYWGIFQSFHSPTLAGFAVISHWLPYLIFSVYAGALADRFDCRKLIQVAPGLLIPWGAFGDRPLIGDWNGDRIVLNDRMALASLKESHPILLPTELQLP